MARLYGDCIELSDFKQGLIENFNNYQALKTDPKTQPCDLSGYLFSHTLDST